MLPLCRHLGVTKHVNVFWDSKAAKLRNATEVQIRNPDMHANFRFRICHSWCYDFSLSFNWHHILPFKCPSSASIHRVHPICGHPLQHLGLASTLAVTASNFTDPFLAAWWTGSSWTSPSCLMSLCLLVEIRCFGDGSGAVELALTIDETWSNLTEDLHWPSEPPKTFVLVDFFDGVSWSNLIVAILLIDMWGWPRLWPSGLPKTQECCQWFLSLAKVGHAPSQSHF